ncbi:serine hydrolase [Paucibacter sediminis]|uniref:Serine hydrolase n=1 Tax=Paucibacter sediminis TaxID=3019553 RepID=A0AA95SP43_9BURK|nr:serine hydrolase domain-containing protein [Paucibacter sp. S2-9]WIT13312.1 serine hydrolase [Paucibacter sp. S2-9]
MSESKAAANTNAKTGVAALDGLFEPFNRSDAPGLIVGVARHGRTLYRRGFGLASVELGVANTAWTRMRIGSTSKHFTCLAVLLLAEDGKLDVDAGVRRYIPELPVLAGEPTLRQLMSHTGGYRCYLDVGFLSEGMAIKPKGVALATQVRQTAVNFAPGEKMMYCNGGYHLLSLVIERISGMPFEQFLQERIFTPLAMQDTTSVPSDFEIHRGMATLHVPLPPEQGGGWRRGIFPTEEVRGEGAMVSTIDDMLAWLAHMRAPAKTVGSAASWQQMVTPARLNNGLVNPYALGLMVHAYRGIDVIHHAGGVIGGSCQMITVPSQALDIIIMTNGAPANPVELAHQIIDALLDPALLGPLDAKPASESFKPMLGTRYHASASGLVFGFAEAADARLGLCFLNMPPVALKQRGDALRLGFEDMAMGPLSLPLAALAGTGEAPAMLELSEGGQAERFERLPATPPALAEVAPALLGRYRAPDLDAEAVVRFEGEKLLLEVFGAFGSHALELEAFAAAVFGWRVSGSPLCGVLSAEPGTDGRMAAFRINTTRTRQMRFERLAD